MSRQIVERQELPLSFDCGPSAMLEDGFHQYFLLRAGRRGHVELALKDSRRENCTVAQYRFFTHTDLNRVQGLLQ